MFELPAGSKLMIGYIDPMRPDCWREWRAKRLVRKIVRAGYPVVLYHGPRIPHTLILTQGWTAKDVEKEILRLARRANHVGSGL